MHESTSVPRLEDVASVGSRISWGAILAGSFLALGVYFLLATLGGAVGFSASDRVAPTTLQNGAIIWAFLITIAALFIGGLVTSLFTAGENKTEAVMSGVITWAVLCVLLLLLSGVGIRAGFNAMPGLFGSPQTASTRGWEAAAREAGVPAQQIEDWRRQHAPTDTTAHDSRNQQPISDATTTQIGWYAFAATWLSMLAGALGAFVGAGPTFRLVAVRGLPRSASLAPAQPGPTYSRT